MGEDPNKTKARRPSQL